MFCKFKQSSFLKNIFVLMSGTAASQILGFLLTPIISRFYSPTDFGILGTFNSILNIIAAGVTLQYCQAIVLPKENDDAIYLFIAACLSTAIFSFLFIITCIVANEFINNLLKTEGYFLLILLILGTIITGINLSCQAWCVRIKAFKIISSAQVLRSITSNGSQICFGYFKIGSAGLVISGIFAEILSSINMMRIVISYFKEREFNLTWYKLKKLSLEYKDFPIYSTSQNVLNALSVGIPVLLLTHFFGIEIAGAYSFGMRMIQVPMGFLLGALRQVLFQKAGETQNSGNLLAPLYVKTAAGLFLIALFPAMILIVWAPNIFKFVFGSQWEIAGEFSRCLIIWLFFYFCNLPAVLFARVIRIQKKIFFYDLILLLVRLVALVIGGLFLSSFNSVLLFSIVGAVMNCILILLVGHAVLKKEGVANFSTVKSYIKDEFKSLYK